MGVPSFVRWLVEKYPNIVMAAKGEVAGDTSLPNPNGIEFDNLYLDMNAIIHPCFHPDDDGDGGDLLFQPASYDEVFASIFDYVDRIFCIVRPRKLLYMAVDGVPPQAKMNQQRARRYRAAKDAEMAEAEEEKLREQFLAEGREVLPQQESEALDPTNITPGTVFMEKLSRALEYYIRLKLNRDPGWKKLKVILSDASVPGEGEHKIMSFIRLQRGLPCYNPNTVHCLYGLDADLIMLALATHEIHFTILREVFGGQQAAVTSSTFEKKFTELSFQARRLNRGLSCKPYQFLKIWTLRKFLELDMQIPDPPFEIDLERLIDDFVFICFFLGNDFLPNIPSIETRERGVDLLISVYKSQFKKIGGYLVDANQMKDKKAAYIKVKRMERFISAVATFEEQIFIKRLIIRQRKVRKMMGISLEAMGIDPEDSWPEVYENSTDTHNDIIENTKALKQTVKSILKDKADLFKQGIFVDKVRLGSPGWRERYYMEQLSATCKEEIESRCKEVVRKYTEGLCWVFQCYFVGVCSWNWCYPFHYGPFACDLKGLVCSSVHFTLGAPSKPFDHLMAVLPPRSAHFLPPPFRRLVLDSKVLKDFYPSDFAVDLDGKRFLWQGIIKPPFIKEEILTAETRKLEGELDEDERKRNSSSLEKMFVLDSDELGKEMCLLHRSSKHLGETSTYEKHTPVDPTKSGGINGFLCPAGGRQEEESCFTSPVKGMPDLMNDHVVHAFYRNPAYHDRVPGLLEGVTVPSEEEISAKDIVRRQLWHEEVFHAGRSRPAVGGGRRWVSPATSGGRGGGWNRKSRSRGRQQV